MAASSASWSHGLMGAQTRPALVRRDGFCRAAGTAGPGCRTDRQFHQRRVVGTGRRPGLPWAMIFPQSGDMQPRHPSQLYHVGLEGIALFVICGFTAGRPTGGGVRRIPDWLRAISASSPNFSANRTTAFSGSPTPISMGQWLSLPMILIGIIAMVVLAYRKSLYNYGLRFHYQTGIVMTRPFKVLGIQQIAIGGPQGKAAHVVGRHVRPRSHQHLRFRARNVDGTSAPWAAVRSRSRST